MNLVAESKGLPQHQICTKTRGFSWVLMPWWRLGRELNIRVSQIQKWAVPALSSLSDPHVSRWHIPPSPGLLSQISQYYWFSHGVVKDVQICVMCPHPPFLSNAALKQPFSHWILLSLALQAATFSQCELIHEMKLSVHASSGAEALFKGLGDALSLLIRCLFHLTMTTAEFQLCNDD